MTAEDWNNPSTKSLGLFLGGRGIDDVDERGRPIVDDNMLLLINASEVDLQFTLPSLEAVSEAWQLLVDTSDDEAQECLSPGERTFLVARSLKFFRAPSRAIRAGGGMHGLGATYRLQFNPSFGFRAASEIVDYLADLGITDVYASPIFAAARGSTHGYDVVDYTRLNEELGSEQDFEQLSERLKARGIGLLLDWVPNHMGIASGQNAAWDDVLESGPNSLRAEYFDIAWAPPRKDLQNRVLLPILGGPYGEVLERGELKLVFEQGRIQLAYFDRRLPLGPKTLIPVLESIARHCSLAEDAPARLELESILSVLRHLPAGATPTVERRRLHDREKALIKYRFLRAYDETPELREALPQALLEFNGAPGVSSSFDALDALLREQSYRLASWQVASEEINYRRFFDVNDLAALRMELEPVFVQAHAKLFSMIASGRVQALRLDHTDGLYDPLGYFEQLQRRFRSPSNQAELSPDDLARPLPVLVEKILEPGEQLPSEWPVDGTTGYEFSAEVGALLVDPRSEPVIEEIYRRFTADTRSFAEHVYESKSYVLRNSLVSEVHMLASQLAEIASKNRAWQDFTLGALTRALTETIAVFPIYRTYLRAGEAPSEQDEAHIREAIDTARRNNPSFNPSTFEFLQSLLLQEADPRDGEGREEHIQFALRFQQLTGPVMAKSVEDTAFYRYPRLLCLNEVGGSPARYGSTIEEFHRQNAARARSWPLSMVTTSTHDTKRGEDTCARIAVLSELPEEWRRLCRRFGQLADSGRQVLDGVRAPSRSDEYLLLQSIIGAWPHGWDGSHGREQFVERMSAYLCKAAKEAKQETSWTNPNPGYDDALRHFIAKLFGNQDLVDAISTFCRRISPYGAVNGLSMMLLRLTVPGIPDTYQDSESWNQSLVDPDNRRPVDYDILRKRLADIRGRTSDRRALARELLQQYEDGRIKTFILMAALQARREKRELFLRGDYEGLTGDDHIVAFTRSHRSDRMICCVPRFPFLLTRGEVPWPLSQVWGDRRLRVPYSGRYLDVCTGGLFTVKNELRLSDLFADLPVALLLRQTA
jgi:(1->4)-alpha-D-glucan 1-alpha-D-glucosylmutase